MGALDKIAGDFDQAPESHAVAAAFRRTVGAPSKWAQTYSTVDRTYDGMSFDSYKSGPYQVFKRQRDE